MHVRERFIFLQAFLHETKLGFPGLVSYHYLLIREVNTRYPPACETRPHLAEESSARSPPDVKFSGRGQSVPPACLLLLLLHLKLDQQQHRAGAPTTTGFRHFRTTLFIWSTTPFLIPAALWLLRTLDAWVSLGLFGFFWLSCS